MPKSVYVSLDPLQLQPQSLESVVEKQKLIIELEAQQKANRALHSKYRNERSNYLFEALAEEGVAVENLRKKSHESKNEMEIVSSKMAMIDICLQALKGNKTCVDIEILAAEERTKLNNYTIAKPWSWARLWGHVAAQPQTKTVELIEKVKAFISPITVAPAKKTYVSAEGLEKCLLDAGVAHDEAARSANLFSPRL